MDNGFEDYWTVTSGGFFYVIAPDGTGQGYSVEMARELIPKLKEFVDGEGSDDL